jgi:NADH:ubiquinone oxidoreductase subunit 4 (subunit M)
MLSIIATLIFLAFIIPASYNMIMFILSQRTQYFDTVEEKQAKGINRIRIRRVVVLFILLPIVMFLLFFCNHLLTH